MTLANILKDRVKIEEKTSTPGPLGESVTWAEIGTRYARVIPLDAKARAVYMQMQSEVTHRIVLRGTVSLNMGLNRFKWKDKTLELVEPPQELDNMTIIVMVKEV